MVNPYFPPRRLIDEIKANFETLLTQYPSGMKVNSLLASKNFGVHQDYILVGNGAAELIKSFMGKMTGAVGIVRPTFEEYSHLYRENDIITFWPSNNNFSYTVEDLISFFKDKQIQTMVVINPDNPSGNYITKANMEKLITWTKNCNVNLLVDESFVDFAEEDNSTLIEQEILKENPHLFVMKSISKSYGVPGLRLGILASGNTELIAELKKDVAIWNINSFAEFYMQIEEKYRKNYAEALQMLRNERKYLENELREISGIRTIPSQANYIMVEITNGMTAAELTRVLIVKHNILIKNLFSKVSIDKRQYIRLAIRNRQDNDRLLAALREEME